MRQYILASFITFYKKAVRFQQMRGVISFNYLGVELMTGESEEEIVTNCLWNIQFNIFTNDNLKTAEGKILSRKLKLKSRKN